MTSTTSQNVRVGRHIAVAGAVILTIVAGCSDSSTGGGSNEKTRPGAVAEGQEGFESLLPAEKPNITLSDRPAGEDVEGDPILPSASLTDEHPAPCEDPQPPGADAEVVLVFFHCDAQGAEGQTHVMALERERPADEREVLGISLQELVRGPTIAERENGFFSVFSEQTSGLVAEVSLSDGLATVDFTEDLYRLSPVGTTNGSGLLIAELTSTVFQFDTVDSAVFTVNGDAASWCEFVTGGQDCQPFTAER